MNSAEICNDVIANNSEKLVVDIRKGLELGLSPDDILNEGLIKAMDIVGVKYSEGELFVPEMLQAAITMKQGLNILKPMLVDSGASEKCKIVIGSVKGDLHDIGKNLVAMMLEGAGFEVFDLGVDVTPEKFVNKVAEHQAQICAMSALLTTTMPGMRDTINLIKKEFDDSSVKTVIGGAPVSQKYADDIGADCFASDAVAAVDAVKEIMNISKSLQ